MQEVVFAKDARLRLPTALRSRVLRKAIRQLSRRCSRSGVGFSIRFTVGRPHTADSARTNMLRQLGWQDKAAIQVQRFSESCIQDGSRL